MIYQIISAFLLESIICYNVITYLNSFIFKALCDIKAKNAINSSH